MNGVIGPHVFPVNTPKFRDETAAPRCGQRRHRRAVRLYLIGIRAPARACAQIRLPFGGVPEKTPRPGGKFRSVPALFRMPERAPPACLPASKRCGCWISLCRSGNFPPRPRLAGPERRSLRSGGFFLARPATGHREAAPAGASKKMHPPQSRAPGHSRRPPGHRSAYSAARMFSLDSAMPVSFRSAAFSSSRLRWSTAAQSARPKRLAQAISVP